MSNGAFPERLARALERDISELRDSLCSITGDLDGKAELSVVTGAECPKFHVDYYVLRLLVTYVGLGTELLRAEAVDWSALGTGGDDFEQANRRIVRDRRGLVRARAGDIVVLRGAKGSGRGAVHRSPPTDRSGIRRLLLKLTVT